MTCFFFGNVVGIIYTLIYVKETKDKTNDEIVKMFTQEIPEEDGPLAVENKKEQIADNVL